MSSRPVPVVAGDVSLTDGDKAPEGLLGRHVHQEQRREGSLAQYESLNEISRKFSQCSMKTTTLRPSRNIVIFLIL